MTWLWLAPQAPEGPVAGQVDYFRLLFSLGLLIVVTAVLARYVNRRNQDKKLEELQMKGELYQPGETFTSFPSLKSTLTGWYPDAEGVKEIYMAEGVLTEYVRPVGYGVITDSVEKRPGGTEQVDSSPS